MSVKPISPKEVAGAKKAAIPEIVYMVFNEMIVENYCNGQAIVKQDEAVKRMVELGLSRKDIFDKGWLDVEDVYKIEGWKVLYDRPAYCESYDAYFEFSKR
jgi:hypothetical protein